LIGVGLLVAVAVWIAPEKAAPVSATQTSGEAAAPAANLLQVQSIVQARCVMCHNAQVAQKGIQLHTPELLIKNAASVYQQAVVSKAMPMANSTGITDAERAAIGSWVLAGAKP
jgi:uncharacterized membrane protein